MYSYAISKAPLPKARRLGLFIFLLFLPPFGALGKTEEGKKVMILSQASSHSNTYLKRGYEKRGHKVVIVFLNTSTRLDASKGTLTTGEASYALQDFDLAYFRTWGNEQARGLAHAWQPIFEKWGVPCMDPLKAKLCNDNKHIMMRLFQEHHIPMPKTVIIEAGTSIEACLKTIKAHFTDLVVIKGEGSGGKGVSFVPTQDEKQLRKTLLAKYTRSDQLALKPLVLQQYVPSKNADGYSYHYRIMVAGSEIVAAARFTASSKTRYASNVSLGAKPTLISIDEVFSPEQQAEIKRACQLTGANVAGVDATLVNSELYI